MNPTIESWNTNPLDVGPLYPLVGWEVPMIVACLAFCATFMIWKFAVENAHYATNVEQLRKPGELSAVLSEHETQE